MEPTQNPTPQEPKKTFWQKLFGGGSKPAPPPSNDLANPSASGLGNSADASVEDNTISPPSASSWNRPVTSDSSDISPGVASAPPATPPVASSDWSTESTSPGSSSPVSSPSVEPNIPAVPSWQDSPVDVPSDDVPVPPSDPMVTPAVPPAEPSPSVSADDMPLSAPQDDTSDWPAKDDSAVSDPDIPSDDESRPPVAPPSR